MNQGSLFGSIHEENQRPKISCYCPLKMCFRGGSTQQICLILRPQGGQCVAVCTCVCTLYIHTLNNKTTTNLYALCVKAYYYSSRCHFRTQIVLESTVVFHTVFHPSRLSIPFSSILPFSLLLRCLPIFFFLHLSLHLHLY